MTVASVDLSQLTTMRVGGPARALLSPTDPDQLVETAQDVWASGEDWLLVGGGSNLVVADEGFDGTAIRVTTRGIERLPGEAIRLRVQAGETWDDVVSYAVERGWRGIEALSG
ncbi:MAG TPA: FAD-binding protein, partial [Mycobacteriales bacterium]